MTYRAPLTVTTSVHKPITDVWEYWTNPLHIKNWCQASADWHAPAAENDLRVGGKFSTTMAAKDGSVSFDFTGIYDAVIPNELIEYTASDGRKVKITFVSTGAHTDITETFDPENENPLEMQQSGWQAILDSFKNYTETQ